MSSGAKRISPVDGSDARLEDANPEAADTGQIQLWWHKTWARLFPHLPWLIIAIGIGLRLFQYSFDRSLWLDEAFIATNLTHKSYGELLGELQWDQRAPAGFLLVEKLVIGILGNSDLALRLFPLLCGILSLFLFHALSRRYLSGGGVAIALALFAFSPPLIYFASELKQYGIEVTVTLLLLLAADHALGVPASWKCLLVLGLTGGIGIWFSFPAPFFLAVIGLCLVVETLRNKNWRRLPAVAVVGVMWLASFAALYLAQLRHFPENPGFKGLWQKGFMPLPPRSLNDLKWFPIRFLATIRDVTGIMLYGLCGLTFLVGVQGFFQKQRLRLCLLLGPALVAVFVSGFRVFPFQDRLILYLAPIVILVMAEGAWCFFGVLRGSLSWTGLVFLAILLMPVVGKAGMQMATWRPYRNWFFRSFSPEETKPVMAYLKANWKKGDVVYLYSQTNVAFNHYAQRFGFKPEDAITGMMAELCLRDWSAVRSDLEPLRGRARVWVFFSHVNTGNGVDEEKLYLYFLDNMGKQLDAYRPFPKCSAGVYLYDLSNSKEKDQSLHREVKPAL